MTERLQSKRRAYRVRGQRADGSWKFKDTMQLHRAESIASRWLKHHTVIRDGVEVAEGPLSNIVIMRSEPLVWLVEEPHGG
ncbi:hypothetical protein SEA_PUREGLOBE5_52 [Arthrobacter phage Pureglobe5]|nr:hypothetical protein SEA_ODYSSEY395_53 [Arthrobacter phage Odyssey395]UYL87415.1 hypothetical protein SEA_PUREGLOBE5_52 [Arthrobacter phage Pureglobe5]